MKLKQVRRPRIWKGSEKTKMKSDPFGGGFALAVLPWLHDLWVTAEESTVKLHGNKGAHKRPKEPAYGCLCTARNVAFSSLYLINPFTLPQGLFVWLWIQHQWNWENVLQNRRIFPSFLILSSPTCRLFSSDPLVSPCYFHTSYFKLNRHVFLREEQ